jgi:hypothetical protein
VHDRERHGVHRAFVFAVRAVKARVAMYFLSTDCHVCKAQGYWIILNLSRDKYLCVTHAALTPIGSSIYGWRGCDGDPANRQPLGDGRDSLIESLLAKGVLTRNSDQGKAFVESVSETSDGTVAALDPVIPTKATIFCLAYFLLACAKADWCLRKWELSRTLAKIERRRPSVGPRVRLLKDSSVTEVIATFKELRPLYPRPYLCLFDSLALLEFLAGYHSYPRIVFGVVADPFQAHCWLQEGDMLLNDDLERVAKYKPILSV